VTTSALAAALAADAWLTTEQAAEYVSRHPSYVLAAARRRELQSIDGGRGRGRRYRREWLEEWMADPKRRETARDRAASTMGQAS